QSVSCDRHPKERGRQGRGECGVDHMKQTLDRFVWLEGEFDIEDDPPRKRHHATKAFDPTRHPRDDAGQFAPADAPPDSHGPRHTTDEHRETLARRATAATVTLGRAVLDALRPRTLTHLAGMLASACRAAVHPKAAAEKAVSSAIGRYQRIEARYGRKAAVAIAGGY